MILLYTRLPPDNMNELRVLYITQENLCADHEVGVDDLPRVRAIFLVICLLIIPTGSMYIGRGKRSLLPQNQLSAVKRGALLYRGAE